MAGWTLSVFGDWAMFIVLGVWAKDLTGSNSAAGLVFFALALPSLFELVPAEALADFRSVVVIVAERGPNGRLVGRAMTEAMPASSSAVPVAERRLTVKIAGSGVGFGATGGTFSTALCSAGTGIFELYHSLS